MEHRRLAIGIAQEQACFDGNVLSDIAWVDPAADFVSMEFNLGHLKCVFEDLRGKKFGGWSVPFGDGLGERFEVFGWLVAHGCWLSQLGFQTGFTKHLDDI
jgi:hypothetical protein